MPQMVGVELTTHEILVLALTLWMSLMSLSVKLNLAFHKRVEQSLQTAILILMTLFLLLLDYQTLNMKPQNIEDVLVRLHSGQWFGWKDSTNKIYENLIIYSEDAKPTKEWLEAEITRLQAEHDATQYKRDRQAEYPSVDELVVALWEGVVEERMASVTALEGLRQAVKTKYPKP